MARPRVHIAMCVRDEAPYLLEWVAHYRVIGATDLTIFHNDCSDGTGRMLRRLEKLGLVTAHENPVNRKRPQKSPQGRAMARMVDMESYRNADWFALFDIDEFLNIHCGARDFASLLAEVGDATDAISVNWRLFGSGGALQFVDEPVTARFLKSGSHNELNLNVQVKTLFRPARFERVALHRPVPFPSNRYADRPLSWINGSGQPIGAEDIRDGVFLAEEKCGIDLVQLNHYAVKSREEFVRTRLRGSGTGKQHRFGWHYWHRFDHNLFEDRSLDTSGLQRGLQELRADPVLDRLHQRAVRKHRKQAAETRKVATVARFLDGKATPGRLRSRPEAPARRKPKRTAPVSPMNKVFPHGETNLIQHIRAFLPNFRVDVIVDVGANVGQTTRRLLQGFPQARVHAIEPGSTAFGRLTDAMDRVENVSCHRVAFSARSYRGHLTKILPLTCNMLTTETGPETEPVDVVTGDAFCAAKGLQEISLLKVDTEGSDLDVLKGFAGMIEAGRIGMIRVESGLNPKNHRHVRLEDFLGFLEPQGYRLFGIYNQVQEFRREPVLRRCDAVFISSAVSEANTLGRPGEAPAEAPAEPALSPR